METVLKNLHAQPGIIGALLADRRGSLIAHSFPPLFDAEILQSVCLDINNTLVGLEDATGGVNLLDLRFDHARLIVKQTATYALVLLCEQSISLPRLMITINVAVNRIGPLISNRPVPDVAMSAPQPVKQEDPSAILNKIVESSFSAGMI